MKVARLSAKPRGKLPNKKKKCNKTTKINKSVKKIPKVPRNFSKPVENTFRSDQKITKTITKVNKT